MKEWAVLLDITHGGWQVGHYASAAPPADIIRGAFSVVTVCFKASALSAPAMDIPFISSGALSRAHYALVRKVEESTSEGAMNRILEAEVGTIRQQLAQPSRLLVGVILLASFGNVIKCTHRNV